MEDGCLSRSWRCYFCNPRIGSDGAIVVPDQKSLEEMLRSIKVTFTLPDVPIERPVYEFPSDIELPLDDSWMCSCQTIYDDEDKLHNIEVKVYLDKKIYHQEMINPPNENVYLNESNSLLSSSMDTDDEQSSELLFDPIFIPEKVSPKKEHREKKKSAYERALEDYEKFYESTISSLGFSERTMTSNRTYTSEEVTADELASFIEDTDMSMSSLESNDITDMIERVERLSTPMSETASQRSRQIECIDLGSDNDESDEKPAKRRRVHREKDISAIDLEAIGLSSYTNNFIRLGDVKKVKSSFGPSPNEDIENEEFYKIRKFRQFYRAELKNRVEEKSDGNDDNNELLSQLIELTHNLSILRKRKENLEALNQANPTFPMEKNLLTFAHPLKISGMSRYPDDARVTPYKMSIKSDEINFASEWSDDLPFKGCYSAKKLNKTGHVTYFLNKITSPIVEASKYDPNDVIKLINQEREKILHQKKSAMSMMNEEAVAPLVEPISNEKIIERAKLLKEASDLFYDL